MLIEANASDFALLLAGSAPPPLTLVPDSTIASPDTMRMLADLAASIRPCFAPSAWMIVEWDEVVGLLSAVRPPGRGELAIGYGVAPSRQQRGIARRAVGDLAAWARNDPRIERLTAQTSVDNLPSQRVLAGNGFVQVGAAKNEEDGQLLAWELRL